MGSRHFYGARFGTNLGYIVSVRQSLTDYENRSLTDFQ